MQALRSFSQSVWARRVFSRSPVLQHLRGPVAPWVMKGKSEHSPQGWARYEMRRYLWRQQSGVWHRNLVQGNNEWCSYYYCLHSFCNEPWFVFLLFFLGKMRTTLNRRNKHMTLKGPGFYFKTFVFMPDPSESLEAHEKDVTRFHWNFPGIFMQPWWLFLWNPSRVFCGRRGAGVDTR